MHYAATGDAAVKAKADELISGLAECQQKLDSKGYVSAFPVELFDRLDRRAAVWAPFYTLHKIMAGLLDMNIHAGNSQGLDVLVKLAGWVDTWTAVKPEEHMQDILNTEFGGMNDVLSTTWRWSRETIAGCRPETASQRRFSSRRWLFVRISSRACTVTPTCLR
jgi:DUF1680 family protein